MSLQEGLELEGVLVLTSNYQMWELAKLLRLNKIVSVINYWLNKSDFNISPLKRDSKKIIGFPFFGLIENSKIIVEASGDLRHEWRTNTYLSFLVYKIINKIISKLLPLKGKSKGRIRNTITHLICQMFSLIINPPGDLLREPGHPYGLATWVVQAGDIEKGRGGQEVDDQVPEECKAE